MNRKVVIAIFSVLFICLLLFGFEQLYGSFYDYFPSWERLPVVSSQPVTIKNIENGSIIVRGEDNLLYRCYFRINDCWHTISEAELKNSFNPNLKKTYEVCDYSKDYFRVWHKFHQDLIDCMAEDEGYGDTGESVVIAIDSQGNVWLHTWEHSAIGSVSISLCCLPLFAALGILVGLILLGEYQKS